MDGTLLTSDNFVTEKTMQVIDAVRKKGINVFIATGRGHDEIAPRTPANFSVDGIISSNGMTGYIGANKLFEHTLPFSVVEAIIELARERKIYYEVFPTSGKQQVEKQDRPMLESEITDSKPEGVGISEWMERQKALEADIMWVDKVEQGDYSKFYFFNKNPKVIESWKERLTELSQNQPFSMSSSTANNVEVMVANKNKGTAIQEMIDQLNLTAEEIIAVGDSFNDESMFEIAGHSVAMKNAPAKIKEMTDETTIYTNDEEGVSRYLEENFL